MPDGDIKKFAPGKLLLSLLIRWSIAKKLQFFDFGLGEETYKKNWSNQKSNIYNHISLKSLKGIFYYIILKARQIVKLIKKSRK